MVTRKINLLFIVTLIYVSVNGFSLKVKRQVLCSPPIYRTHENEHFQKIQVATVCCQNSGVKSCTHKKCPEYTHFDDFGNCEYDFPDCGEGMTLGGEVRYERCNETDSCTKPCNGDQWCEIQVCSPIQLTQRPKAIW